MPRILEHVVGQHAENAAFLWLLRDKAVDAPHYNSHHLADLDDRIEANLDGLRVAGEEGWCIAMMELARHQESGELFTTGVLALESGNPAWIDPLVAIAKSISDARRGFLSALGWVPPEQLKPTIQTWLDGNDEFRRFLSVVACAHHRVDPGSRLVAWLEDDDRDVRMRAVQLAGELGRTDLRQTLVSAISRDPEELCRLWAAWSAGLLGDRAGLDLLIAIAKGDGPLSGSALEVAVRLAKSDEICTWIRISDYQPACNHRALKALGFFGDPSAIPWILDQMDEPHCARAAGESFSLITGVDLKSQNLDRSPLWTFAQGDSTNTLGIDEASDPDEDLAWPNRSGVAEWWQRNAAHFHRGVRYICGHPIDSSACERVFSECYQRQRRSAAFESAMLQENTPLRNWRAASKSGRSRNTINPAT